MFRTDDLRSRIERDEQSALVEEIIRTTLIEIRELCRLRIGGRIKKVLGEMGNHTTKQLQDHFVSR